MASIVFDGDRHLRIFQNLPNGQLFFQLLLEPSERQAASLDPSDLRVSEAAVLLDGVLAGQVWFTKYLNGEHVLRSDRVFGLRFALGVEMRCRSNRCNKYQASEHVFHCAIP